MEDWMRVAMEFSSPALDDLVPDLSREEHLRLQKQFRERERIWKRHNKSPPPLPPRCSEQSRDAFIFPNVFHTLRHYNARHPGAEFDAVKPLMECCVGFRGTSGSTSTSGLAAEAPPAAAAR